MSENNDKETVAVYRWEPHYPYPTASHGPIQYAEVTDGAE